MSHPLPSRRTRAGLVALLGRANVGKSTLLNAIVGEPIAITSAHPQTTRQTVRGVVTRRDTQYVLLDTPGLHAAKTKLGARMNEAARSAAREADAIVLLVEAPGDGRVDARLEADMAIAADLVGKSTVVAITKIDRLADKSRLLPMSAAVAKRLGIQRIVPVSARESDGIARLLDELRLLLPRQPFFFDEDTMTDQPTRFFVAEFVREQILNHLRQEIPHGAAVVIDRFDESGKVIQIEATVHVAREAHKKIAIGGGGRMMRAIGTAARGRIETLLSRRVHLKLWVRATPGWVDDEAMLRTLGYSKAGGS